MVLYKYGRKGNQDIDLRNVTQNSLSLLVAEAGIGLGSWCRTGHLRPIKQQNAGR